jgi:hypothetical protein
MYIYHLVATEVHELVAKQLRHVLEHFLNHLERDVRGVGCLASRHHRAAMYVCMYVCIYMCMYVCIYVYILSCEWASPG